MRKGIANVLRDYYRLESRAYSGDFDTAVVLADLMSAINGDVLTVRQRQYIALYFFCGLKFEEVAYVAGDVRTARVQETVAEAFRRLTSVYSADEGRFKQRTPDDFSGYDGAVFRWLDDIASGQPIGEPSRDVLLNIAEILRHHDDESAEMIRQRAEGYVIVEDEDDGPEYPHYTEKQMSRAYVKNSFVPEVLPPGDVTGSKRVAPRYYEKNEDDEAEDDHITRAIHRTGRVKIFKMRGN